MPNTMDVASRSAAWCLPGLDGSSLRVSAQLGHGAFARCWLAEYNGRQVALKVMIPRPKLPEPSPAACPSSAAANGPPEEPPAELYERMFFREAHVMTQLHHRHIVRCLGFTELPAGFVPDQPQPAPAMVLELCKPYTLKDLITRGMAAGRRAYKVKQAYAWLKQVATALAHLHSQKPPIIHRDIKPENILLMRETANGELICKVSDLGLHVSVSEDRSVMLRRKSARRDTSIRAGGAAGSGGSGAASFVDRSTEGCSSRRGTAAADGRCTEDQQAAGLAGSRGTSAGGAARCGVGESPFLTVSTGRNGSTVSSRSSGRKEPQQPQSPAAARLLPDARHDEQSPPQQAPYIRTSEANSPGVAVNTAAARAYRIPVSPDADGRQGARGHAPETEQLELREQQLRPLRLQVERQASLDMMMLPLPPALPPACSPPQQQLQMQDQPQQDFNQQEQIQQQQQDYHQHHQHHQHQHQHHHQQQQQPNFTRSRGIAGQGEIQSNDCPLEIEPDVDDVAKGQKGASPRCAGDRGAAAGAAAEVPTPGTRHHDDDGGKIPAAAPGSPISTTISTLLCRHPDLVEAVPHQNPGAGLRQVRSLLKQLGKAELQPLRRHEMEWVYGLTGQAGSFMYMAPEVFLNEPYNEKSDVFSFGVLAYELLASELLLISIFNTARGKQLGVSDPRDYAELVAKADYRPPRLHQAVSDAAWALIQSCWHPDPVQRPTMAVVETRLGELQAEAELDRTGGATAAAATAQQQRRLSQQNPKQPRHQAAGHGRSDRAPRVLVSGAPLACCGPCIIS